MNRRRVALAAGVLSLVVGGAALVAPGTVGFGFGDGVVVIVGLAALFQTVRVIQARRHATLDRAETTDPERAPPAHAPGEDFEAVLSTFLDQGRLLRHRTRVRDGLRTAAIAVLVRFEGLSEAEARARLDDGTWTSDRHAAAFLGDDVAEPGLRSRLRGALGRTSTFRRQIRRTVDEITTIAYVPPPGESDGLLDGVFGRARTGETSDGSAPSDCTTPGETGADGESSDRVFRPTHAAGHWRGVSAVALLGIGLGILGEAPAVLLAGVVGVGYAAFARSSALPPGPLSIDRTVDQERPDPGDTVTVSVTVTNESGRPLPDVRVVDGVPAALDVADGSPRLGTAVRTGESVTFEYAVTARRGVHAFNPAHVVARDLSGAVEQERLVSSPTTVTCVPPLRPLEAAAPLRELVSPYAGQVETSSGGEGIEFHATREYRPGDPVRRIDWNHRARTGELTTVTYRRERSARIVVLVDARPAAYASPDGRPPHAVDRAVDAAGRLFASLSAAGNRVGLAAVGGESCWLPPDSGPDHRTRARELLATHPALSPVRGGDDSTSARAAALLRQRLSAGTQLVFVTPLCDEAPVRLARRWEASGHPVTVVSPDPSTDESGSHRLARVARRLRVVRLRGSGLPVVDWPWDQSLDVALARNEPRRSR